MGSNNDIPHQKRVSKVTFTYDPDADAIYIRLSRKVLAYTKEVDDQRHIDYADDGTAIGIELLYTSDGIKVEGLPHPELVLRVVKAAACLRKAGTASQTSVTLSA